VSLTDTLAGIVGAAHVITDPDVLDGRSVDHTGRYRGTASALVRPGSADEVAAVLGRRDVAIAHYERAIAIDDAAGLAPWAQRARAGLARLIG